MPDRPPRWYSHAKIKRYGWRTWYINSPRIWRAGLHVVVNLFSSTFGLGIFIFRDEDDDEPVVLYQLLWISVRVTGVRYWTKHEERRREVRASDAEKKLVNEIEEFLK